VRRWRFRRAPAAALAQKHANRSRRRERARCARACSTPWNSACAFAVTTSLSVSGNGREELCPLQRRESRHSETRAEADARTAPLEPRGVLEGGAGGARRCFSIPHLGFRAGRRRGGGSSVRASKVDDGWCRWLLLTVVGGGRRACGPAEQQRARTKAGVIIWQGCDDDIKRTVVHNNKTHPNRWAIGRS
jgi:hypothetical protein